MLHDDVGTVLARTAYHEVAAGFGAEGILVKTTAEVPDALRRARRTAKAGRSEVECLVTSWLSRPCRGRRDCERMRRPFITWEHAWRWRATDRIASRSDDTHLGIRN